MEETNIGNKAEQVIPVQEQGWPLPESLPEQAHERKFEQVANDTAETHAPAVMPIKSVSAAPTSSVATLAKQVEWAMEEGLEEAYKSMDPNTQQKFQRAGEETAGKIEELLRDSKVQSKKILDLIISWLRIIPGVNRFFLEQEAKIKADKILALRQPYL